jgi:hypothetical protein
VRPGDSPSTSALPQFAIPGQKDKGKAVPIGGIEVSCGPNQLVVAKRGNHAGDYAILVAMHITTNEDPKWTWETFWWNYDQPFPDAWLPCLYMP